MKVTVGNTIFDIDSHQEIEKLVDAPGGFAFAFSPAALASPRQDRPLTGMNPFISLQETILQVSRYTTGGARGGGGSPPRAQ